MSLFHKPTDCRDCGGAGYREVWSMSEQKTSHLHCNRCEGGGVDPEDTVPRFTYFQVACGGVIVGGGVVNTIYLVLGSIS